MDIDTFKIVIIVILIIFAIRYYILKKQRSGDKDMVYLIYRPGCGHCKMLKAEAWPRFLNSYGTEYIMEINTEVEPIPPYILNAFGGVPPNGVPAIFKIINGKSLMFSNQVRNEYNLLNWAYNTNSM